MEFWTTLIVVSKEQSMNATKFLKDNCTYVANCCWIFEGEIECISEAGVKFNEISGGAVPWLGDMPNSELVQLCEDVFGINIYNQAYKSGTRARQ